MASYNFALAKSLLALAPSGSTAVLPVYGVLAAPLPVSCPQVLVDGCRLWAHAVFVADKYSQVPPEEVSTVGHVSIFTGTTWGDDG